MLDDVSKNLLKDSYMADSTGIIGIGITGITGNGITGNGITGIGDDLKTKSPTVIKKELKQIKKGQTQKGKVRTLPLADLVMVQMIGDFEGFLKLISNGTPNEEVSSFLENVRGTSTSLKLFTGIVDKSIEAQFGEKHVAIRELGQNAIDSYGPGDVQKPVLFKVEEEKTPHP